MAPPRAKEPLLRKRRRKKSQKQRKLRQQKHQSLAQHLKNPKIRKALVVCHQSALFYERLVFAVN